MNPPEAMLKPFEFIFLVELAILFAGFLITMGSWVAQDRRNWKQFWEDLEKRDREEAIRRLELQARQFPQRSPRA
jgi:hypothetical protein